MTIKAFASVIAALSANGLGAALTSTGASYVLTANNAGATDTVGHLITIKGNAATDHSGKTFTIVGTDANGRPQSEGIAGPNGAVTVTSTKYFATVATITPSATTGADTFDMGWTAGAVSPTHQVNLNTLLPLNIGIGSTVITGSPNYSLQYTYDGVGWFTHATITGKTANFDGVMTTPCVAMRMLYSVAGSVTHTFIQHDKFGQ